MLRKETAACLAILALGLVAGGSGCSPAEAEALEVTYYYLPG